MPSFDIFFVSLFSFLLFSLVPMLLLLLLLLFFSFVLPPPSDPLVPFRRQKDNIKSAVYSNLPSGEPRILPTNFSASLMSLLIKDSRAARNASTLMVGDDNFSL